MKVDAHEDLAASSRSRAPGIARSMFGDGKNAEVLDLVSPPKPCLYAGAGESPGDVLTDDVT